MVMRTGPISRSENIPTPPIPHSVSDFDRQLQFASSLQGLGTAAKQTVLPVLAFLREKIVSFFNWIYSWFITPPKPKVVDYFKVIEGHAAKYRLILNGKQTDNSVRFSHTSSSLQELSLPDQNNLSKMIALIMKREKIDAIQTSKLQYAHILWKCGLKSESAVMCNLRTASPLNLLLKSVLQQAFQNRRSLNSLARAALARIEDLIVQSIIGEQVTHLMELEDCFDPSPCRGNIDVIEEILGSRIDLAGVIKRAEAEKKDPQLIHSLKATAQSQEKMIPDDPTIEFGLRIEDIFILIDATKTPLNRFIDTPNLIFTKRVK